MLPIVVLAFAAAPPRATLELPPGALFRVGSPPAPVFGVPWRAPAQFDAFASTADGRLFAFASSTDGKVTFHDGRTGREVGSAELKPDGSIPRFHQGNLRFSADGKRLYWADTGKTVRALAVPGGDLIRTYTGPVTSRTVQLGLSADGAELAALWPADRGAATLCRWDAASGRQVLTRELPGQSILSPRGDLAASVQSFGGKRITRVTDVSTGKALWDAPCPSGSRGARAFSPDSATLVVELPSIRGLEALDARTGKARFRIDFSNAEPMISPDGKTILMRNTTDTALFDASTGERLPTRPPQRPARGAQHQFAGPDRLALISAPHLWLVDLKSGAPLTPAPPVAPAVTDQTPRAVAFTPDSKALLVESGTGVRELSLPDGKRSRPVLTRVRPSIGPFAVSPDGKWVVAQSGATTLLVSDRRTGKAVTELNGAGLSVAGRLAFSPDGRAVYYLLASQPLRRWDVETGKLTSLGTWSPAGLGYGGSVAEGPTADGRRLLGHGIGRFTWLDLDGGKVSNGAASGWANPAAWAPLPGSKQAVVAGGGLISVHDADTGRAERSWAVGGHLSRLTPSPDGRVLALQTSGPVRLWDLKAARELRPLPAHPNGTTGVAFSEDGKFLATCGRDNQVLVWDAAAVTRADRPPQALHPAEWRQRWEELGDEVSLVQEAAMSWLHLAAEQTIEEMPRVMSHDLRPENVRRAQVGTALLRRIGTPAARRLLESFKDAPAGSPWRGF